jgi:hypothetical protein
MGAIIHLANPTPSSTDAAARVAYWVGRSLTAADFARNDRYLAQRLLGVTPATLGVMSGLGLTIAGSGAFPGRFDSPNGTTGLTQITVAPGYATGGDGRLVRVTAPITIAWSDLPPVVQGTGTLADGIYFLMVQTIEFDVIEGPPPDPCQRTSMDPLLDERRDSFVEVTLSSLLGTLPTDRSPAGVARALNTLLGGLSSAALRAACANGVPLAILLVAGGQAIMLSQAAGRLPADPAGIRAMLLSQMREAIAMAFADPAANPASPAWQQATAAARFRYFPAAGELPLAMLQNLLVNVPTTPAATAAICPFFDQPGVTVYLRAIRSSQAPHMVRQALPRVPLDLASGAAEGVILSLAVPDGDWTPDLMDVPRADPMLPADLHFAYARARAAQVAVREAWIALYGGMNVLTSATPPAPPPPTFTAMTILLVPDAAATSLAALAPAAAATTSPMQDAEAVATKPAALATWIDANITVATPAGNVANLLGQQGYQVLDVEPLPADPTATAFAPVASDQVLAALYSYLPASSTFSDWQNAVTAATPNPALLQPLLDAGVIDASMSAADQAQAVAKLLALPAATDPANDDTQPGALLTLAMLQLFYVVFARAVRAQEWRLAAHNRLIALQRMHLDIISTSVSTLAGGSPTDGSGLKFTRMIPFFKLQAPPGTTAAAPAIITGSTSPTGTATPAAAAGAAAAPPAAAPMSTLSIPAVSSFARPQLAMRQNISPTVGSGINVASTPTSSALAGSGLSFGVGRVAPGITLNLGNRGLTGTTFTGGTLAGSTFAGSIANRTDVVSTVPPSIQTVLTPAPSGIGSLIGATDVAATVSSEIGTISQTPPFAFPTVQYGTAAHITPGATAKQVADTGLSALHTLMADTSIGITTPTPVTTTLPAGSLDTETLAYSGLLDTSRALLGDISLVEKNAIGIESNYLRNRDLLQSLEAQIATATQTLATARDTLRSAQSAGAQADGDYASAQRLVQEELARVVAAAIQRRNSLAAATGLFYVRRLHAIVARNAAPSLALTANTPDDIVPGCAIDHAGPPAAIQPFLDLLLEVPLADWYWLRDLWTDLPDFAGIQRLGALRAARVSSWALSSNFGSGAAAPDLASIALATRSVLDPVFQRTVQLGNSLAFTQQTALSVFAFHDIITLPANGLRTSAEALRVRLESAAGCLSETLMSLPPSARFAWAAQARDGTLVPLAFSQWVLPTGLGDAGTSALRRLAALVNWMTGQLHDRSSAAAQSALGNLVRAAVIAAAYGDPDEAVNGTVATGGAVIVPGLPIRVTLNRTLPIGTLLNLYDGNQKVVGTVRVADQDAYGTSVHVVSSYTAAPPTSGWTVRATGARAPRLPL